MVSTPTFKFWDLRKSAIFFAENIFPILSKIYFVRFSKSETLRTLFLLITSLRIIVS